VSTAVLSLLLGGCSFINDTSQDLGVVGLDPIQQRALADTVRRLTLIGDVESVSTSSTPEDLWGSDVELDVTVREEASDEPERDIAAAMRQTFESYELTNVSVLLIVRVTGDTNGTFELREFD